MYRKGPDEIEAFVGLGSILAGKYRIHRLLGAGGMGAVVEAHHEQLRERVAIKFLLPRIGQNQRLAARFLREARTARRLRSAHVARVFDIDSRSDGTPFIVMEYLDGENLAARFRRDRELSAALIVDDVLEACVAVAEAHALGIVHRDLKPANLFAARTVGAALTIRVLDFGISKLLEPDPSDDVITQDLPIGSPPYMSPEQFTLPASVDHRTDIWSLGVVLYEGLTGRVPFAGDTFAQVCAHVLQDPPPVIAGQPELDEIVKRCLAKEREQRFPSVEALAAALSRHAGERGLRASSLLEHWSRQRSLTPEPCLETPMHGESLLSQDIVTLTATANPTRIPAQSQRVVRRSLGTLALALLLGLSLFVRPRAPENRSLRLPNDPSHSADPSARSGTATDATGAPSVSGQAATSGVAVRPSAAPSAPPVNTPQSASSVSASKPKLRQAGGFRRAFDPVFDERR
jgi:serine/threonine-protein kinase